MAGTGRGPTIGNFPYQPNPPGDARYWVQATNGDNMGTSVDDITRRAVAAMPPADYSALVALLADPGGNSLAAQILAQLRANSQLIPSLLPLPVAFSPAALPLPVNVTNPTPFPSSLAVSGTVSLAGPITIAPNQAVSITGKVPMLSPGAAAAAAGTLYVASVGPQALLATPAPIAMLVNPPGSTKTLYLDSFAFSGGQDAFLTRGRLTTIPTGSLGTAVPVPVNSLGAASTPVGKLYLNPGTAAAGATVEWSTHTKGGTPLTVAVDGRVAIPPNSAAVWSAQALGAILNTGLLIQAVVCPQWSEL